MFISLLVSLLVLVISYTLWRNRKLPPGPWGVPILGYLPWLDPTKPYVTFTELSKKYGPIYGLSLGNVYTVVLTDPKVIKQLFFRDDTTGRAPLYLTHGIMQGYGTYRNSLGLICAEGELWKEQRRFVHNCLRLFGASKIGPQRDKMESLIKENVLDFVKYIDGVGDVPIDPLEPLRHSLGSTMNIIVFGKSWARDDETWKWLQHLQEEGTQHIGVAGPLNFLPFLRFVPKFKQTMNFLIDGKHETHKVYQKIIGEQKSWLEQQTEDELSTNKNVSNIIQAYLAERERRKNSPEIVEKFYNDQQFNHLLADLFGAGLDTTLTTLRWYLLFLARYPIIQTSIRKQIQETLQEDPPTVEDMRYLPLVEASLYETQRIRSVVPVGIPHGALEDLEVAGMRIPKGTMIVPLQWAIHMDEDVWVKPEEFNPWRFLNNEGEVVKSDYFMPYQVGKRMCVGDDLARKLLFLFGATIIQNFSFELEFPGANLFGECGITLTPKPYKLIFTKIKTGNSSS